MNDDEQRASSHDSDLTLTPADVVAKRFDNALLRGYRPKQVEAFLHRAADALEQHRAQIRKLNAENEDLKRQLADYRERETTLHNALASAQTLAADTVDSAKRQADAMVAEARMQKEKLLLEAKQLPGELTAEIRRLKEQRARLRHELTMILETHTNLLRQEASLERNSATGDSTSHNAAKGGEA